MILVVPEALAKPKSQQADDNRTPIPTARRAILNASSIAS
jgi:hypothetical protein